MNKKLSFVCALVLLAAILAGCAGDIVVVQKDPAPVDVVVVTAEPAPVDTSVVTPAPTAEIVPDVNPDQSTAAERTGLALIATATAEAGAKVEYDISIAAVTVNDAGIITSCAIDSLGTKVTIDATGAVTSDITAAPQTKTELGDAYGLKAYAGSAYEWYEQARAVADFAAGKTVDELKNGAVAGNGKAPADSDLATMATISIGGYVQAIEKAVQNAQPLGAQTGDTLRIAVQASLADTKPATAEKSGTVQLNCDVVALTENGGKITSCVLDSVQGKVNVSTTGAIETDLTAPFQTKNELGEAYGMKAYAGSRFEWNEQAAAFAAYVTGKTASDVAGIAVSAGKATDADLSASVTISIGNFQALIAKALS